MVIYFVLNPFPKFGMRNPRVNARRLGCTTDVSPGNNAHQRPFASSKALQGTTRITLIQSSIHFMRLAVITLIKKGLCACPSDY